LRRKRTDDTKATAGTDNNIIQPITVTPTPTPPAVDPTAEQAAREAQHKRKELDDKIYFCKLEIDRHEKAAQMDHDSIANLDATLANPMLAYSERQKLEDIRQFREDDLHKEQLSLSSTQAELRQWTLQRSELSGTPVQPIGDNSVYFQVTTIEGTAKLSAESQNFSDQLRMQATP
jgi:hypothetical protein